MKKLICLVTALLIFVSSLPASALDAPVQQPRIIETVYPTRDTVVADVVLTEAPYYADPTGEKDCAPALQAAIDYVYSSGGGTVFLPVGSYRLCSGVSVRPFVTVMGDRQDPDLGTDYGTVIIADVESSESFNPALFTVGGSAGVMGLTVWYPDQSIDNVKPYPYTFYVNGAGSDYMLQSIVNCTLLNSYRGIGVGSEWLNGKYECHEMLTVENVKGTCLTEGIADYNSADVDTVKTFFISPDYWVAAGEKFNAPEKEALRRFTRENLTALVIGDLEWPELCNVKADCCKYGIHIVNGPRASFSGTFSDLSLTGCEYGIFAEEGAVMHRGRQWGYSVFRGKIEAEKYAVYDCNKSVVMLTDVKVSGKIKGKNIHREKADTAGLDAEYSKGCIKPAAKLFVVNADKSGKTDVSRQIQSVLDLAQGGGVVYLPAGVYRLDAPLNVPAGVELRGAGSAAGRCLSGNSNGTLLLSYYGYCNENKRMSPLITLNDRSGLNNIRINFLLNCPRDKSGGFIPTVPAVSITGSDAHAVNCFVILASDGFVISGAENTFLSRNVGCCISSFISGENSSTIYIDGCLQNGNALPRNGYASFGIPGLENWLQEKDLFDFFFIPVSRLHTDFLTFDNCKGVKIVNTFIYGGRRFMRAENSEIFACNIGCDGQSKEYYTLSLDNCSAVFAGVMKSTSDGKGGTLSYEAKGGTKLKIYDRISVDLPYGERTVIRGFTPGTLFGRDALNLILQPVYGLIEAVGGIFTEK